MVSNHRFTNSDRVVFGVSASPFLAQYVTQQYSKKWKSDFPLAAEAVLTSTYMDDTMTSANNDEEAKAMYSQLCSLWQSAGMYPRKWMSNSLELLQAIPKEDRASQLELGDTEMPSVKTLGIMWEATKDQFTFQVNPISEQTELSKRFLLKKIAMLF